ncbi:Rab1a [Hexamita inflata]|uniref:Rab1a n=1 Tax=Hexamita inflata TaxID=28002 RepID=A0AA86NH61_9EUKA|nr:Rab1a [Hexamita inflata]
MNIINNNILRITLVGASCDGKTSLLLRYLNNEYNPDTMSLTIGADLFRKDIHHNNITVELCLCDTAGQERFEQLIESYYKKSNIVISVYDVTNYQSFEKTQSWIHKIQNSQPDTLLAICGNKCDYEFNQWEVDPDEALKFSADNNTLFFQTSAKDNLNITEMFKTVVEHYYSVRIPKIQNENEITNNISITIEKQNE